MVLFRFEIFNEFRLNSWSLFSTVVKSNDRSIRTPVLATTESSANNFITNLYLRHYVIFNFIQWNELLQYL